MILPAFDRCLPVRGEQGRVDGLVLLLPRLIHVVVEVLYLQVNHESAMRRTER